MSNSRLMIKKVKRFSSPLSLKHFFAIEEAAQNCPGLSLATRERLLYFQVLPESPEFDSHEVWFTREIIGMPPQGWDILDLPPRKICRWNVPKDDLPSWENVERFVSSLKCLSPSWGLGITPRGTFFVQHIFMDRVSKET